MKKEYSFAEVDKSLKEHRLIKKINISVFGFHVALHLPVLLQISLCGSVNQTVMG